MREVEGLLEEFLERFLQEHLPKLSDRWWNDCIKRKLSDDYNVQRGAQGLDELDFAGLLNASIANWGKQGRFGNTIEPGLFSISNIPYEVKDLLFETRKIRNKWIGHRTKKRRENYSPEDKYRDYDTIYRLLTGLGALDTELSQVDEIRKEALRLILPRTLKEGADGHNIINTNFLEKQPVSLSDRNEWAYFATGTQANAYNTRDLAVGHGWICRTAFNSVGQAIANTKRVNVGDVMYLCFGQKVLSAFEILSPSKSLGGFNAMGIIPEDLWDHLQRIRYKKDPKINSFTGFRVRPVDSSEMRYSKGDRIAQQSRNALQRIW